MASLRCAPVSFTAFCQKKSSIVIENCGAGVSALVGTALKPAANALKTASLVKSLLFISTPLTQNLLCATSVSSVSLWLLLLRNSEPQRHRGHRGCTEKSKHRCLPVLAPNAAQAIADLSDRRV